MELSEITYDETIVQRILKFAKYCIQSEDNWYGKPLTLLPWQTKWIYDVYAPHVAGERLINRACLFIPKKVSPTKSIRT